MNLGARIDEAARQGWHGESEGLQIRLAATREKLAHMDQIAARQDDAHLDMPGFSRTVTTPGRPLPTGKR
jgi:hypothetical protein